MALTNLSQVTSSGIHTLSNYTTHNINSTGIITATEFSGNLSNSSGISTFAEIRVTGNLTVEGTTTTLDSNLTEVDRIEVGANSTNPGIAVTQSGTGHVATFEGGNFGIGTNNPSRILHVSSNNDQYIRVTSTNSANAGIEFGDAADKGRANIVYANSDDSMFFTVNGSEKARISSAGRVGIGTNNPATKVHIEGTPYIRSKNTGAPSDEKTWDFNAGTDGILRFRNTNDAANSSNNWLEVERNGVQTDSIRLLTGTGTERLRIASGGYVGINETTPSNRLHVKETNSNTIVGKLESSVAYSYLSIEDNSTTTGNVRVGAHGNDFVINAGAVQRLRISSTGSVTIGSGNDDSSMPEFGSNTGGLTIDDVGGSNTGLRLSHGNDDTYLVQAGNGNFYVAQFGTGSMRFGVGSSGQERLRITSGGNLQVKGGNLHLDSNAELALFEDNTSGTYTNSAKIAFDFSGNVARMRSSVNGSASLRDLAFYTANTAAIYIKTDANVGIGENAPNNRLHIVKDNNVSYTPDQATQNPNNQLKIENHSTTADSFVSMAMRARACDFHLGVKNNGADNSGRLFLVHQDTTNKEVVSVLSTGSVGISSATPKTDVDISQKTGAVALPQGTTAQRPTGSAPYIRKNTTNNALEYFDGTSWVEIITDYFPTGSTILG